MTPYAILGLPDDADTPQIKRAYAKLLRTHRPDEDAAAFQRLHEAYEHCLADARWRAEMAQWEDADDDADDASDEDATAAAARIVIDPTVLPWQGVSTQQPTTVTFEGSDANDSATTSSRPVADGAHWRVVQPTAGDDDAAAVTATEPFVEDAPPLSFDDAPFDADAFIDDLRAQIDHGDPHALDAWLHGHEALYSLDRKQALRPMVTWMLGALERAPEQRCYDTTTAFFGLDKVGGGNDWFTHQLEQAQRRMDDVANFERTLRLHDSSGSSWTDRLLVRELLGPRHWLRRGFLIVFPGLPSRVGALLRRLRADSPEAAAERLDAHTVDFWDNVTDRTRMGRQRTVAMALRVLLWTLPFALLSALSIEEPIHAGALLIGFGMQFAGGFGLWLAYALLTAGWFGLLRYNERQLQWDLLSLLVGGLALLGFGLECFGTGLGWIAYGIGFFLWLGGRGERDGGNKWATIGTLLCGFLFALLFIVNLMRDRGDLPLAPAIAALYAYTLVIGHDLVYARRQRIAIPAAHEERGWLWWIVAAHGFMLLPLLMSGD